MQNGPKRIMNRRDTRPVASSAGRSKRWTSNGSEPKVSQSANGNQSAHRNYERYLALAQAQILAGDKVEAENYFQHAEHYLRSMSPDLRAL